MILEGGARRCSCASTTVCDRSWSCSSTWPSPLKCTRPPEFLASV